MRSLFDSFIEFDRDTAVFSILKLGKRFVSIVEEIVDGGRQVTVLGFTKASAKELFDNTGVTIDSIDDVRNILPGRVIFERTLVEEKKRGVMKTILENAGLSSTVNWSSSYRISRDQLERLFSVVEQDRENPPLYDSINRQGHDGLGEGLYNNHTWLTKILRCLEISPLFEERDPTMLGMEDTGATFSFRDPTASESHRLLEASYNGDIEASQLAVTRGANVNSQVSVGVTRSLSAFCHVTKLQGIYGHDKFSPLMFAVCRSNVVMVRYLIENRADPDIEIEIAHRHYTAMDFAILLHAKDLVELFYDMDAKHFLPISYISQNNRRELETLGLEEFMPQARDTLTVDLQRGFVVMPRAGKAKSSSSSEEKREDSAYSSGVTMFASERSHAIPSSAVPQPTSHEESVITPMDDASDDLHKDKGKGAADADAEEKEVVKMYTDHPPASLQTMDRRHNSPDVSDDETDVAGETAAHTPRYGW